MIYLKDYRNPLNNPDDSSGGKGNALSRELQGHIGQTITVFTASGGESGRGFTGVLLEVREDTIRLLTRPASPPGRRCRSHLGTITVINREAVTAFSINFI